MGNDTSKSKCGFPLAHHKRASCQAQEKADCDWNDYESKVIPAYYAAIPELLTRKYRELFETTERDYIKQQNEFLPDYEKTSQDQFDTYVDMLQKELDEYALKGARTCDEIMNSPEYKQKLQETIDLKKKQIEDSEALRKMNFENLNRDEINKALRQIIPGINSCESTMAGELELEKQADIEEEDGEEEEEMEGGNLSKTMYNINKRFIMHNIDESPIKNYKNKKYYK